MRDTEHALTGRSKSHVAYPINFDRKQEKKLTSLIFTRVLGSKFQAESLFFIHGASLRNVTYEFRSFATVREISHKLTEHRRKMTLYHFGNCLALVYVPYYLTYKYSGLSEYGAFWKCIQAGGIYIFTQLVKMLALATFFPTADNVGEEGFDILGEFLKSSIDLADLVGILLVLNSIPGKGHAKVLTAGIGWAGAEVLLTRFLLLWVGARGAEFDWKYIQKSLESNINLVQHITTATLVWLWSRHDLRRGLVPIVIGMLVLTVYRPLMLDFLSSLLLAGPWSTLIIKAITTFFIGATTLHIYAGLAHSIGIF